MASLSIFLSMCEMIHFKSLFLVQENNYTHYLALTRSSLVSLTDSFSGKRKRKRKNKKLGFGEAVKSRELLFDFPELEQLYMVCISDQSS